MGLSGTEGFWPRRAHILILTGNGSALVLLGRFMGKTSVLVESLQAAKEYFIAFIIRVIFIALATFVGI